MNEMYRALSVGRPPLVDVEVGRAGPRKLGVTVRFYDSGDPVEPDAVMAATEHAMRSFWDHVGKAMEGAGGGLYVSHPVVTVHAADPIDPLSKGHALTVTAHVTQVAEGVSLVPAPGWNTAPEKWWSDKVSLSPVVGDLDDLMDQPQPTPEDLAAAKVLGVDPNVIDVTDIVRPYFASIKARVQKVEDTI
jgi:hypothetical protein